MSDPQHSAEIGARERALVDLVKLDYDSTLKTMSGVLATGAAIRAAGFATWGVLLGLGLRDGSWGLCALAAVLIGLFAYADAHHGALYRRGLRRAVRLEALLDRYIDRLGIDADDEDAVFATIAALETHRFGTYRTMPKLRARELVLARPLPIFRVLYPALAAATVAVALITGL